MNILSIIVIAVAVISAIVFLYVKIKKLGLRQVAIDAIVLAEKKGFIEKLTGSQKFNEAFDIVYSLLPDLLKCFVTKVLVIKFIQKVFDEIKIALDYKNTDI